MKVFIYAETEAASAVRNAERAAGNAAFLRNPQYFNPASFDGDCMKVYADDLKVRQAYEALGIEVLPIIAPEPEAVIEEEMPAEPEPEPVKRGKGRPRKQ